MTAVPCGVKRLGSAAAQIVIPLAIDVPSGSVLTCVVGALGHTHDIETAQIASLAPAFMDGGSTGFFTTLNECERVFTQSLSADLSAGDTVTVIMEDAGQGFTTLMWGVLTYEG